ncbi:MAG TPA: tetratricopeptide repeat protein, partial [Anaeromyxobacteraceae bacterium]|nr:tetratricopeptide repeat protein [Anaeromyxobacteraceae bacterium]
SFQDLVLLRTAAGLLRSCVPAARVRRALSRLRAGLPAGRSLASVNVAADGRDVVVREGGRAWRPDSGQLLLDFDVSDLARRVAPLVREAARARGPGALHAEAFYAWGCDLDPGAPREARAAYERALAIDPAHAGASLNLGRLLHEQGDLAGAESLYRRALASPDQEGTAAFNLGVLLEDRGRDPEALEAYARALRADPALADAHFNASRVLERLGRKKEALRHLGAYRRMVRR